MSFHPDYEDILSMHLKGGAPIEGFNYALCRLASRSTEAIQVMLDRDINVSALRDFTGDTPLHYAIRNFRVTNIAVCEMLVKVCDVDIEARNTSGDSCLDCAILHHNSAALCWLINVGANINCHNLAYLHLIENYRCAIILLAAGGALNFVDAISDSQLSTATLIDKMPIPIIHAIIGAFNNTDNVIISLLFSTSVSRANVDTNLVNRARKDIAKERLDFCRNRALQICIGLHSLDLPALQMCEILLFACGPVAPLVPFHQWWKITTTVKHFLVKSLDI